MHSVSPSAGLSDSKRVIGIVGPTASGKTVLADRIAHDLASEIVTADSMQVYRGMDIGTAKPPMQERSVTHHCLDLVDPGAPYSAALFQSDARSIIDALLGAEKTPVLCGGTGLYIRAALDDMQFPSGELSSNSRFELEKLAKQIGPQAMHDKLDIVDPDSAALIHPNNVRRTIRALEIAAQGGSYAQLAAGFSKRCEHYPSVLIGLSMDREVLYARIDARVDGMIESGLLHEVEQLLDAGFREALTAAQAIGYKELVPVLETGQDLREAVPLIKQATRRYAKRQITWFKADPRIQWIDVTNMSVDDVALVASDLLASIGLEYRPNGEPAT